MWNVATGIEEYRYMSGGAPLYHAVFSPDGELVIAGGPVPQLYVLNASDGSLVGKLNCGGISGLIRFTPDGNRFVSTDTNGRAHLWNVRELRDHVLRGHNARLRSAKFTPDGKRIATTSDDKTVRLWDAQTGRFIRTFVGHTDLVVDIAFNHDGRLAVTGSRDRTARIWNVETGRSLLTVRHDGTVRSVEFSADDSRILTGSVDKTARVWDAKTGKILLTLKESASIMSAKFSPDDTKILTGVEGLFSRVWDARSGAEIALIPTPSSIVLDIAWSPNGRRIALAESGNSPNVLEVLPNAPAMELSGNIVRGALSVDFNPTSTHLLTAGIDGEARIWNVTTGKPILTLFHGTGLLRARYRPDGKFIATVGRDRVVRIWDAETGRALDEMQGNNDAVIRGAFSPKGDRLVTSGLESVARLWNIEEWSGDVATLDAWRKCRVPWELRHGTLVPAALDPTACPKLPKQLR